jgi:peptide/nickel transport system substrate-binding protein
MSPVINLNLDGRGRRGYFGWADGAEMEHLREAFTSETDPAKQQPIATELQRL